MGIKILEKSWCIKLDKIEEGYLYDPDQFIVRANTINEAKKLLLKECIGVYLANTGEEVSYLTIPVVRSKENDLVLYNGSEMIRHSIEKHNSLAEHKANMEKIKNDDTITHCYVRKGGYYYREGSCGYTELTIYAGVYTKEEALRECLSCSDDVVAVPINPKEHNDYINGEISKLKNKLINV